MATSTSPFVYYLDYLQVPVKCLVWYDITDNIYRNTISCVQHDSYIRQWYIISIIIPPTPPRYKPGSLSDASCNNSCHLHNVSYIITSEWSDAVILGNVCVTLVQPEKVIFWSTKEYHIRLLLMWLPAILMQVKKYNRIRQLTAYLPTCLQDMD